MAKSLKDLASRIKDLLSQRIPFTPSFEQKRQQELEKFQASPFAQKVGPAIYKMFEKRPALAQFMEGMLAAPRRLVSIGGGVPQQLITEKAPVTGWQKTARIGGEMAGAAPYWMLGGAAIEAPLAAKIATTPFGRTLAGKALTFATSRAAATPFLSPFISQEGTLKERVDPRGLAGATAQDIAFSALLTGALKPLAKVLPEVKIPKKLPSLVEQARKSESVEEFVKSLKTSKEFGFAGEKEITVDLPIKDIRGRLLRMEEFRDMAERGGLPVKGREVKKPILVRVEDLTDLENTRVDIADGHQRLRQAIANEQETIPARIFLPEDAPQLTDFYTQATKGVEKGVGGYSKKLLDKQGIAYTPEQASYITKNGTMIAQSSAGQHVKMVKDIGITGKEPEATYMKTTGDMRIKTTPTEVNISFHQKPTAEQLAIIEKAGQGKKIIFDDYTSGKVVSGEGLPSVVGEGVEKVPKIKIKAPEAPTIKIKPKEIAEYESRVLEEARREVKAARMADPNQQLFSKMRNFLRFAGEKTSKETNELFREHIPRNVFGISSDELASAMGKTENELMTEMSTGLRMGGEMTKAALAKVAKQAKTLYQKLDPEFYTTIKDVLGKVEAVSVEPTKKTIIKITGRAEKAAQKAQEIAYKEWQKAIRSETMTPKEAMNQGFKMMKEATNEVVKDRLSKESGGLLGVEIRSPEWVLKHFGRHEDIYMPLKKGQEQVSLELARDYIPKVNKWFKEVKGIKNASQRIFDYLDGNLIELSPPELKVANEIQGYLTKWADRLGLPQERRIANYITHIFEPDFVGGKRTFPEELSRILDYVTPNKEFNPFLEQRLGAKGYKRDVFEALDAYVYRGTRKVYLDKPLGKAAEMVGNLPAQVSIYVDKFLKTFKNRPSEFEKTLDQNVLRGLPPQVRQYLGNRPLNRLTRALTAQVYRGTIGLNIASPLRNLTQSVNTYTILGERGILDGVVGLGTKGTKELFDNQVMGDIIYAEYKARPMRSAVAKIDNVLFGLFELTERINRGIAYYGAKAKFLRQGLSEAKAIEGAKEIVRRTQFEYGKLGMPLAYQTPIGRAGFQLSSFALKQAEFVGGMVSQRHYTELARYILSSLAVVYASKRFLKDVLGMKYTDMFAKNVFPSLGPIPQAIGGAVSFARAEPEQREWMAKREAKRLAGLFIPAGTQLKKTIEGVKAIREEGAYTGKGRLQYPVGTRPWEKYTVPIFGKYSVPEAREYFEKELKPLGETQTELYRQISDKTGLYKKIMEARAINKEVEKAKEQIKSFQGSQEIGDKIIYWDEKTKEVKSISKSAFEKSVRDAEYSLDVDRLKRAENYKEWREKTVDYLEYLDRYQQTLDPTYEKDDILRVQNKIEDLLAQIEKYDGYGGAFKKGKKGKKPAKITIKKVTVPKVTIKTKIPSAKLKLKKAPTFKITGARRLKIPMPSRELRKVRIKPVSYGPVLTA